MILHGLTYISWICVAKQYLIPVSLELRKIAGTQGGPHIDL
jgi:hypothetical protein